MTITMTMHVNKVVITVQILLVQYGCEEVKIPFGPGAGEVPF